MSKSILFGTDDDDGLNGSNVADVIVGFGGNDVLTGNGGDDLLIGDGLSPAQVQFVSSDGDGVRGSGASANAHFSTTGTQIVFESSSANFTGGASSEIYVKDLVTGVLMLVSTAQFGGAADGSSSDANFSPDGKSVVFTSTGDNLGPGDSYPGADIYVKDLTTGRTSLVSTARDGTQSDGASAHAAFLGAGKVLFESDGDNLVANDTNGVRDIFLKSLSTGTVRLISSNSDGDAANAASGHAVANGDGTMVAFESAASNLSAADGNGATDIYVKDLVTNETFLVSSAKDGTVGDGASTGASFSSLGSKVLFSSLADNLMTHDGNAASDVFVKNLATGGITLLSTNADGIQGNGASWGAVFSPDGKHIAFLSDATNFVDNDTNGVTDAFVKDLITGDITRISLSNAGVQGDLASTAISWSPDGTTLLLQSNADNLTADSDTNHTSDIFTVALNPVMGGDDILDGGNGNDTFLPGHGQDWITGGDGNDIAYFRADFDGGDRFDGGTGSDTMVLEGNYFEQVYFGAGVINVETLLLKGHYTYNLGAVDETVAAGGILVVDGSADDAVHSIRFDGSAEQDGSFRIFGGAGNDALLGGAGADIIDLSRGGNDSVAAGGGNDTLYMGATLTAADVINGGSGNDTLYLDGGVQVQSALLLTSIEDIEMTGGHSYRLQVGDAIGDYGSSVAINAGQLGVADKLTFDGSAEANAAFFVIAGAGNDIITGGWGNDIINLSLGGNEQVNGGAGNDLFVFGDTLTASDKIDGGTGGNTVAISSAGNVRGGALTITGAMLKNVSTIELDEAGHTFNLKATDDLVAGGQILTVDGHVLTSAGFTFNGAAETSASFRLIGSVGSDMLTGGAGNDIIDASQIFNNASGNDILSGGAGDDTITLSSAAGTGTHVDGGLGTDTLVFDPVSAGTITIGAQFTTNIERLELANASYVTTDAALAAGKFLAVEVSNANFDGSAEANGAFFIDGAANSVSTSIVGGALGDTLDFRNAYASILSGGGGDDLIYGSYGGGTIYGGAGNDTVFGGFGSTTIDGGAGNDHLTGTNADDVLIGGTGNDVLTGGYGYDTLTGGTGNDTFVIVPPPDPSLGYRYHTWITDFDASADKIDLWFNVVGTNPREGLKYYLGAVSEQQNLEETLGANELTAHHAVIVTGTDPVDPSENRTYIVVDVNGVAGFQYGQDLFILATGATHLSNFSSADFI